MFGSCSDLIAVKCIEASNNLSLNCGLDSFGGLASNAGRPAVNLLYFALGLQLTLSLLSPMHIWSALVCSMMLILLHNLFFKA